MQLKIEHLTILSLTSLYSHRTEKRKNVAHLISLAHAGDESHFRHLVNENYLELTTVNVDNEKYMCAKLTSKGIKLVDSFLIATEED